MGRLDTGEVTAVGVECFMRTRLAPPAVAYTPSVREIILLLANRIAEITEDPAMPDRNKVAVIRDLAIKMKIVGDGE